MLEIHYAQQARRRARGKRCAFSGAGRCVQRAMLLTSRLTPGVSFRCLLRGHGLLRYLGRHRGEADDAGAGRE